MPELKPLDRISEPDRRHDGFVIANFRTGETRPVDLTDFHADISDVTLTGSASEQVVDHFTIARNLYLYSWYVYDFTTPAQAHAYASVEFALRERHATENIKLKSKKPGLRMLLESAIKQGWLRDDGYTHLFPKYEEYLADEFDQPPTPDSAGIDLCEILLGTIPSLRNSLAHGSSLLMTPGMALRPLKICAATINQLFPANANDEEIE